MVYVITFEVPYTPIWDEGVLHSLVYSAIEAANEAPVILRTSKEWAQEFYQSDFVELFVDYIRFDAELVGEMKPYPITDGPLPDAWQSVFNEIIQARNGAKGLFRQTDN